MSVDDRMLSGGWSTLITAEFGEFGPSGNHGLKASDQRLSLLVSLSTTIGKPTFQSEKAIGRLSSDP
jgi:hypothetical protein